MFYEQPRPSAWWAFACPEHAEHLIAARPLLDRDRTEIGRRRTPGEHAEPLAVGRAARDLLGQARRWAAARPEQAYTPPIAAPAAANSDRAQRATAANPFAAYACYPPALDRALPDVGQQLHP